MNWIVEFSPLLPQDVLVALGGAGAVLAAGLLWNRARGALLRTGALALLLLALANPNLRQEDREPLSNIVVVAVDESASQRFTGRDGATAEARKQLSEKLGAIPDMEVRWVSSPLGRGSDRDGTLLFGDLGKTLSDIPPDRLAGVVLLTDGQIHDVPASAKDFGLQVPVHAIIAGERDEFDRRLEVVRAPRFGFVGGVQYAEVRVVDLPARAGGKTVALTVRREGQPDETLRVRPGETVEVPIRFRHAGLNIVELEVEAAPGELTTANNKAVLAAEGVRENLRVLLVSGEPHAGERTWRNLLKSDAAVDLVHFTILRPPEKQDGTPINQLSLIAFPTRELFSEKLDEFDLIIFDRYHRRGVLPLLYLDNVAQYVENGGAVLVAAGPRYASPTSLYRTPLSQILPAAPTGRVIEKPYRPAITETGKRHPVTRGLRENASGPPQWGRWFRLIEAEGARGDVLMNGPDDKPLLILNRLKKGRVALLLSDHAWLWARGFEGGGPYTALLRRLAHWLMKEPDLEEDILRASGDETSLTIERHSMKDNVEPVEVTLPNGKTRSVELAPAGPGYWRKVLDIRDNGVYRLKSGGLRAVAHIGRMNTKELSTLSATAERIQPILEQTGGGSFWTGRDAAAVKLPRLAMLRSGRVMHGAAWMGFRKRDAYVTRGVRLIPLFSGLIALALLLGALSLTWFREGR
ncbi:MAG TPA: hypothetical protein ENH05_05965 [Rhizobiales bacterium]|nr:hypothetical protein BMS3Bbin10_01434 [bacterium BMS3Bbin10]HDO52267.1 hypothetical protein [Hyphomicrobiales bacterium]